MSSLEFTTTGRNHRDAVDRIGVDGGMTDLERRSFQDALRGAFSALDVDNNRLHDSELIEPPGAFRARDRLLTGDGR